MWLGLAHFHNGFGFLVISPNLHDIWSLFLLIPSHYETAHLLTLLRLPGDGYSVCCVSIREVCGMQVYCLDKLCGGCL